MKVTFRKVTESKIPKEPKPNEKDLNKKEFKGKFTNEPLENPKKKVATDPKDSISNKLRKQKGAKQVVERNDFAPEGPDGFDDLGDQNRQAQLDALNQTTNPVAEGRIVILSFEDFLNEAEDFKSQFAPTNIDGGTETQAQEDDDDSDVPTPEEQPQEGDNEEGPDDDSKDNDWYLGDQTPSEDEGPVGEPEEQHDDTDATQTELTSINAQLTDMLKDYKDGKLNVQQYKEKASPLLKQRKDLQAKMDQVFNMSLSGEDETGEGTPDGDLRF